MPVVPIWLRFRSPDEYQGACEDIRALPFEKRERQLLIRSTATLAAMNQPKPRAPGEHWVRFTEAMEELGYGEPSDA